MGLGIRVLPRLLTALKASETFEIKRHECKSPPYWRPLQDKTLHNSLAGFHERYLEPRLLFGEPCFLNRWEAKGKALRKPCRTLGGAMPARQRLT